MKTVLTPNSQLPSATLSLRGTLLKGTVLGNIARLVCLTGSFAVATAVAAPALADSWEPTPPTTPFSGSSTSTEKANAVVNRLQSSNYKVILNKIGAAPLDQCTVLSITPGQQVTGPVTAGAKSINQQVLFTTVYVTADCSKLATPEPVTVQGAGG
jgi:hypothetical protein